MNLPVRAVWSVALLVVVLGFVGSGCVTMKQGERMQADIRANAATLEENRKVLRRLEERISALEKDLAALKKSFHDYLHISREKAAGTLVTLDQFKYEIQQLQGLIEEVSYQTKQMRTVYDEQLSNIRQQQEEIASQLESLQAHTDAAQVASSASKNDKKSKKQKSISNGELPKDKKELFRLGRKLLKQKDYLHARKVLHEFLKRYPKDRLADDAQYMIGKSYFEERRYNEAITEFQNVLTMYPNGDMVDWATYMLGESFLALGLKSDSKVFYLQVLDKTKRKVLKRKAEERLKKLK